MNHSKQTLRCLGAGVFLLFAGGFSGVHAADALDQSVQLSRDNNRQEQQSQKRIDVLSDQTREMLDKYQLLNRELDALATYNDQLERIVQSQEEEKVSFREQLEEMALTQQEIMPLMLRMIDQLGLFLETDLPFLPAERRQRVSLLRELLDRADVTLAEKYRRVLEAYQIELDYGRTIEAYRDELDVNGTRRTVDMLRVGRIGLYYQSLDGKYSGYRDQASKTWVALDGMDRLAVRQGLRVARQQVAPELLRVQVPVPRREQR
ncbi:MAG: DUF3450 domain-containing protein [Pseudomonadota bacterium]|nr:DUF3450 domain-containing protein [Pseudomonadota bacterium]